jgi:hypothetical protein
MPSRLQSHLEILWSEANIDTVLEAQERLIAIATKQDLPELVEALRSERNNFWTRELLAEPIAYLGGPDFLPELFDAKEKNHNDRHDNDSLNFFLTEIADAEPAACKAKLESLMESPDFPHRNYAKWLLEFCK